MGVQLGGGVAVAIGLVVVLRLVHVLGAGRQEVERSLHLAAGVVLRFHWVLLWYVVCQCGPPAAAILSPGASSAR